MYICVHKMLHTSIQTQHTSICMGTCINIQRGSWQQWVSNNTVRLHSNYCKGIWNLPFGDSDAMLWQHGETLTQAPWVPYFTLYHLFWMPCSKGWPVIIFFSLLYVCHFTKSTGASVCVFPATFTACHMTSGKALGPLADKLRVL